MRGPCCTLTRGKAGFLGDPWPEAPPRAGQLQTWGGDLGASHIRSFRPSPAQAAPGCVVLGFAAQTSRFALPEVSQACTWRGLPFLLRRPRSSASESPSCCGIGLAGGVCHTMR